MLVFSPPKIVLVSYLYIVLLCVSNKYQLTFPNISCDVIFNDPVRFLYAHGVGMLHTEIWSYHNQVHLLLHEKK